MSVTSQAQQQHSHGKQRLEKCVGAVSTSQWAVMLCGWGVKAGMVREWVAGKTT